MKRSFFLLLTLSMLCSGGAMGNSKRNQWEPSHYIWNFGIIARSDKGITANPEQYFASEPQQFNATLYHNLKAGDIVWMKALWVPEFCKQILPLLQAPIVIVVADGDESFPSECGSFNVDSLLNHPNVIHVFAQNCDYAGSSSKISSIPIGMDFHTVAYKGINGGWGEKGSPQEQEAQLNAILSQLQSTHLRKKRAFVDFQTSDTMHGNLQRHLQCGEDRTSIFQQLVPSGVIDHGGRMRRSHLWAKKGEYAFSISPHGNGWDCHRTWEDLILGCIVIVKTSCLDPLYEGLPVVIVKEWSEVTSENMEKWLEQYGDVLNNAAYREKLTLSYWLSQMQELANQYKVKA